MIVLRFGDEILIFGDFSRFEILKLFFFVDVLYLVVKFNYNLLLFWV